MLIIVDRKHKRANSDDQWKDPLGVEVAQKSHENEIEVHMKDNPIDKFLLEWPDAKCLLGKTAYALRHDDTVIAGRIVDVYPGRLILIKTSKGENRPAEFEKVIALEG